MEARNFSRNWNACERSVCKVHGFNSFNEDCEDSTPWRIFTISKIMESHTPTSLIALDWSKQNLGSFREKVQSERLGYMLRKFSFIILDLISGLSLSTWTWVKPWVLEKEMYSNGLQLIGSQHLSRSIFYPYEFEGLHCPAIELVPDHQAYMIIWFDDSCQIFTFIHKLLPLFPKLTHFL